MLLILTNSIDSTTDEIVRRIGTDRVFRFNIDLWREYSIEIDACGFRLTDPTGRAVESTGVKTCYVRKPSFDEPLTIPAGGCPEAWVRAQMLYVCQEIYTLCHEAGTVRLVEKGAERRFGKFVQLRLAARFFPVPEWKFVKRFSSPIFSQPTVAKTLVADFVEHYRMFYTTPVQSGSLDPTYPWFLQDEVDADADLTVVYVAGRCFAFTLDRSTFSGVDWRRHINTQDLAWTRWHLPPELQHGIQGFMDEAGLAFGRLDFLLKGPTAYFLEVNPNGQWAWLDIDGGQGIFDAVVHELTKNWTTPGAPPDVQRQHSCLERS